MTLTRWIAEMAWVVSLPIKGIFYGCFLALGYAGSVIIAVPIIIAAFLWRPKETVLSVANYLSE